MIDRFLYPLQERLLKPVADFAARRNVDPDLVTILGFGLGLGAVPALWFSKFWLASALIVLNRFCDGLDGAIARRKGPTDRGAFLDIGLDFFFYACIPLGFALADPQNNALAAAFLLTSFVGTGSSFLAFSVVASRKGIRNPEFPTKGIYYLGGLTEGFETIVFFIALCAWPAWFSQLASAFAILCIITTVMRWKQGWDAFASPKHVAQNVTQLNRARNHIERSPS